MLRYLLLLGLAAALVAVPALADQVLTLKSHSDEVKVMGQKTAAQDITQEYWFGPDAIRFEGGDTSVIFRLDLQKLFFVDHADKSYAVIALPFDFESLVGPEMAPMMAQMMKMMAATVTVTPTDRTGSFAGYSCRYQKIDISMGMVQMAMDSCSTEDLPIDYERYKSLYKAQAEMIPNGTWMKDLAEKLKGFPLRQETTTTMMGNSFESWQELQSIEERAAPGGHYDPPAGYTETRYDPMARAQEGRRRR